MKKLFLALTSVVICLAGCSKEEIIPVENQSEDFSSETRSETKSNYDFIVDNIYYTILSEEEGNYTCEVSPKSLTIYENFNITYESDYSGNVVIPSSVTNDGKTYTVTAIGDGAFYKASFIESIDLPNTITRIGENAFDQAHAPNEIPNSVTEICSQAFKNCQSLPEHLVIPNSVKTIGSGAFGYTGISSVKLPDSIEVLEGGMFELCTNLTSVEIPNTVTSIGGSAFYGCI